MRRQDRLYWSGSGHGRTSILTNKIFTCDWRLLPPFSSLVPCFFLSKSHRSLPFPTCDSSSEHHVVRLLRSWNFLYLYPIMCPVSLGRERRMTHDGGIHTWTMGLRFSWDSPGRRQGMKAWSPFSDRVISPPATVSLCPCVFVCMCLCVDEPFMGCSLSCGERGVAGAGYNLGSPTCQCSSTLSCEDGDKLFML